MSRYDHDNPPPWQILNGSHSYGMSPEVEGQWAWAFMSFGFVAGVVVTLGAFNLFAWWLL